MVIIGAGNSGLMAACRASKMGLKVLCIEKHNLEGGAAQSFVRGRFEFEASLHEKASVALPPRVILPDVFHAVVGDTLQLFYRGLVEHPYPYFYNIEFRCDIGKNTPRYYEVTPTAE